MKHIVDDVNKLELTFKTIDLEGRVPSTDSIEFLSVEEPYREGRRYSPFVRVRYALNGVKQDKAFPMDVDKGIFLSIDDDVLEEKLRPIAPKIVEILQEHALKHNLSLYYDNKVWSSKGDIMPKDAKAMFELLAGNFRDLLHIYRILLCLNAADIYKNEPEPRYFFELDIADRKCTVSTPVVLEKGVYTMYLVNAICAISEKRNPRWKDHVCLGRIFEDLGDDIFKKEFYDPLIQLIEETPKEEKAESLSKIRNKMVVHFSDIYELGETVGSNNIRPILEQMHSCFLEINDRFNMNSEVIEEIREEKIGMA